MTESSMYLYVNILITTIISRVKNDTGASKTEYTNNQWKKIV